MGILSGLKKFGVDMDEDIYGDNKAKISEEQALKAAKAKEEAEKQAAAAAAKKAADEASYLLAKSYECPVCDKPFKSLAVKANRSRVVSSDIDLKPIYEPVDTLKYTVVSCPYCGYSALTRTFPYLTSNQKKFVREKITKKYASSLSKGDQTTYSYEEALKRYELAFATAMAITAKTSEKAYLCLSMSWLVRGQRKLLDVNSPDYSEKYKEYIEAEKELQEKALEGFSYAIQTENYPMCGNMDQHTVDYITAALYYKTGNYDASLKLLSGIIVSNSASRRIKDNARDLKDRIAAAKKNPDQIVPVD